jgi:hypothetical protein
VGLLKPALINANPLLAKSRGARVGGATTAAGAVRPLTADALTKRRTSVSELIWTNQYLDHEKYLNTAENEIESVSSGHTFISNGLEKSHVVQVITDEEYNDEEMAKIRQNAQMAGICNNLLFCPITID